jgi:heme-degrading monooxygenase HmoA
MFIAMNRFRVAKGSEAAFEQVWMSRDSRLVPLTVPTSLQPIGAGGFTCFSGLPPTLGAAV